MIADCLAWVAGNDGAPCPSISLFWEFFLSNGFLPFPLNSFLSLLLYLESRDFFFKGNIFCCNFYLAFKVWSAAKSGIKFKGNHGPVACSLSTSRYQVPLLLSSCLAVRTNASQYILELGTGGDVQRSSR